jgi:putative PIN family toxin of toxin-antitoxin system
MRIMLDTNILISAIKSANGTPYNAYVKAVTPPNKVVLCDQIVDEIRRVFNHKFPNDVALVEQFLAVALFETVPTPSSESKVDSENLVRDAADRPILRAAVKSNIDILVTGDKDFLESGVSIPKIMTAAEFVKM